MEKVVADLAGRRERESEPWEGVMKAHEALSSSFSASLAAFAALQGEADVLRREAEDVMGRKEAGSAEIKFKFRYSAT